MRMRSSLIGPLVSLALLSVPALEGQVVAAGAATAVAVAPHLAAALPAVLTSTVSAGSAHVGQAVLAKLVSGSMLSDGTKLPAGTQLLGTVTQAVPLSKGGGQSSLGMVFDRFRLPNGQERPLSSSVVRSIESSRERSRGEDDAMDASVSGDVNARAQARANANASASTNGGLLGGVVNGVGNTVGGVASGVGNTVGDTVGTVGSTVTGLAGVVVDGAGTLAARGRNVTVPSGTRVTIATSASASAQ